MGLWGTGMSKAERDLTQEEIIEKSRELCKSSLRFLCKQFLNYEDWDEVHEDLEVFLKKPSRKKALILPRGHLKSTFVTIAFSIQQILKNPNIRILIANQVWDMSRKFLSEIKAQLEQSHLKSLFGNFVSARWNADEIIVRQRTRPKKEPTVLTTGLEGESTGGHFDLIILDDLTGLQNSKTTEQREKTKAYRRSMINLLDPAGLLIDIGTRWHLDDTFAVIFEKEMKYYDVMVRKVIENGKVIFPKHFAKKFNDVRKDWMTVDDPTCLDYIDHLRASMPLEDFYAQYLNDPVAAENQMIQSEMFRYWNQKPEGLYVSMAVDFAISQKREADFTGIVVLGMDSEYRIYVLDAIRGHWTPAQIVDNIFQKQSQWRPFEVGMETNGFQRTLKLACEAEMRTRKQFFSIVEVKNGPDKQKDNRIKSLEPFYRRGDVFHAAYMKGKDLESELLTFPRGKHDDLVDAMSMCLPLLSRGNAQQGEQVHDGSWEWHARQAREYQRPFQGFFYG